MRLIDLDAIMAQFPKADFYGDAIENMKAYPYWKTDITGLINILEDVPIIEQSEDCISRAEALKAIEEEKLDWGNAGVEAIDGCLEAVGNLPSVTPQQKVGKWIDEGFYAEGHSEHAYRCSECGEHYIGYVGEFKYCPNCGAKMEVEK